MRLVLCGVAAQGALAEPFQLEAVGSKRSLGKVTAIGDFHPQRDPTLQTANSVFGAPTKVVRTSNVSCRVLYGAIGLRFAFVNLGGGGGCTPALTKSQVARAFDPRWHTGKGLQIGDRQRKPAAPLPRRHASRPLLVARQGPQHLRGGSAPVRCAAGDDERSPGELVCLADRRRGRMSPR